MRGLLLSVRHTKHKLTFGFGIALAVLGLSVLGNVGVQKVSAAGDCDSNSIIYCGFSSASDFINKVKVNDSGNGHHDLQAVYTNYGLEPASYDQFVKYARPGTLYADGHIVVDGQTVANGATTIGRNAGSQGSGYFSKAIPNAGTFYGNAAGATFAAGRTSLPIMALFNAQGKLQFSVLTACGNPVGSTPVTPTYSCNLLRHAPVSGQLNTYTFNTSAAAANNASIAKLVYDFGDGTSATTTDINTSVKHTYSKAGTFTAKVTVYVNLPGNQQVAVSSGSCAWQVTIVLPFYQCLQTAGALIATNNKYAYKFTTSTKFGAGASLAKVIYNWGDGQSNSSTAADGAQTHSYAKGGTYTVKATAYFNVTGQSQQSTTSTGCQTKVPVAQPFYSCTSLATPVVDKTNKYKYSFSAKSSYGNGATLAKYVYNFGDGGTGTSTASNGAITHTYSKAGTFTAKVTVYVNRHGDSQASATSNACQQKFTVVSPFYSCIQLGGSILDQSKYSYRFVATAKYGNGAQPVSADFNFGDGKTVTGVKFSGSTFTTDHTYAAAGNYNIAATLHFTANGANVTAPACKALVTPTTAPTPECKPGIPVGSPLCTPCQYDSSLPSDSPQCAAPLPGELPNTGAGNVVAIFGGVAVVGFLIYRQLLFHKHKAAFNAAQAGTSPLPLGQPLDDQAPLTGTPLVTKKRHTFRRKRMF